MTPSISQFNRHRSLSNYANRINYYVDSVNGDDLNGGALPDQAFATLAAANAVATDGDTVGLARGSTWTTMLVPGAGVTYDAYGAGDNPTVDTSADGGAASALSAIDVASFVCKNITFIGSGGLGCVYVYGASGAGGYKARLENCDISNNSALGLQSGFDGVSAGGTAEIWLENCAIHDCYRPDMSIRHQAVTAHTESKIYVNGGTVDYCDLVFQNTLTAQTYAYGVTITSTRSAVVVSQNNTNAPITLDACTIINDDAGFLISSSADGDQSQLVTIKNCTITHTGYSGLGYLRGINLLLQNNDITINIPGGELRWQLVLAPSTIVSKGNRWNISGITSATGLFRTGINGSVMSFTGDTFNGIADTFIVLYSYDVTTTFNYCIFQSVSDYVVKANEGALGTTTISNCTFYNSTEQIFNWDLTSSAGTLAVNNCIFHTCTDPIDGAWNVTPSNNCYYNSADEGGTGSITDDPLLVTLGSDWHLQTGSPCINAGIDVGLTVDFDGVAISGLPDIGALEYVA